MGKHLLVLLLGAMFLATSHAKATEPLDLPACQVARTKTAYTGAVDIPDQVKSYTAAYKKSWVDLCARKQGSSVSQTLGMARALEDKFKPILWSAWEEARPADGDPDWDKHEVFHDYFRNVLPTFMPAFEGTLVNGVHFRIRLFDFKLLAPYGNTEDKLFFQLYSDLVGYRSLPPWHGSIVDDHYACIKFGETDWIQAFQNFEKTKELKIVQYKNFIPEMERSLTGTFENLYSSYPDKEFYEICTCKKKDAVKPDLERLVAFLKRGRIHSELAARLQATLKAIKVGQIPVYSEAEKPCAGGIAYQ